MALLHIVFLPKDPKDQEAVQCEGKSLFGTSDGFLYWRWGRYRNRVERQGYSGERIELAPMNMYKSPIWKPATS